MSRSATPVTQNEATRRLKPPKRTTSAKLPIGTAIRSSRERLRTVANGCDHKRNVERTHPQPPDPQSETGTLATHSGKERHIHHVSENSHVSTKTDLQQHRYQPSCLHQHHFRACDICLHVSHEHSKCLDLANISKNNIPHEL